MSASIHQEVVIKASPQHIYETLTNSKQFSEFTGGAVADISPQPGGAFSCFGGMISGCNVELVPNRRIVQAWRAGNWPEGVYSIVRFELEPDGAETKIIFDQSGFPDESRTHLESGWYKMYWDPIRSYLA
jgi:uncharacterized protein YndB with AHSA1/START domain